MGYPVVHFEVGAADDAPPVAFYGELCGWALQPTEGCTLIGTRGSGGESAFGW